MPEQPKNRPNPQEAVARAKAAAAPKVAKAMESAGPAVEKAAAGAGKLFGTLRERAKETAKSFADAYGSDEDDGSPPDRAAQAPDPATQNPATQNPATQNPATQNPATQNPATQNPANRAPQTQDPAAEAGTPRRPRPRPGPC
jgi:hypothetical protein